jgi:hypothetical protein
LELELIKEALFERVNKQRAVKKTMVIFIVMLLNQQDDGGENKDDNLECSGWWHRSSGAKF